MYSAHVKVSYPETPGVRLGDLYKGDSFILSSNLYRDYTTVYVAMETPCGGCVKCFNLNNGNTELLHCNTKVIEMVVEINARPKTNKDRNDLPFLTGGKQC